MRIVKPKIVIVDPIDGSTILKKLEESGRKCWQSGESKDPNKFLNAIIKRGHTSVLEHQSLTFDITTDRSVLCELTRHRIGVGYSVESTRYVKYDKGNMEFIEPIEMLDNSKLYDIWMDACQQSEYNYIQMMSNGAKAQEARAVLNNSLKTEIRFTGNMRALRHFFELRADVAAHPHIKEIAIPMLMYLKERMPVLFDDIKYDEKFWEEHKERLMSYIVDYHENDQDILLAE